MKNNQGFIILFTVLVSTIVLLIAIGISNLSLKQIELSASAREGHRAFYAADTGIECSLYHDSNGAFPSSGGTSMTIDCADTSISVAYDSIDQVYEYEVPLFDGEACAEVFVYKGTADDGSAGQTRIESFGTNVDCGESSPRKVERALRVTYPSVS